MIWSKPIAPGTFPERFGVKPLAPELFRSERVWRCEGGEVIWGNKTTFGCQYHSFEVLLAKKGWFISELAE
jgi:hypothetical protein